MRKSMTKIVKTSVAVAMSLGMSIGANVSNSKNAQRLVATEADLVFSFNYGDIPDGYTATTGTSGDFTVGVNPNVLTVNYGGINTKSSAGADDHAYGYAMFLKNYGYLYSGNSFSGFYVSNVRVVIGANSGVSGKIGVSFGAEAITSRDSSVDGTFAKGQTYDFPNTNKSYFYWNFSTTGANVQIDSLRITYSDVNVADTYTISFNTNGGPSVDSQSVPKTGSDKATRPEDPIRTGYTFINWYEDNNTFNTLYDFNKAVTSDLELFAKWEKISSTSSYSASSLTANNLYRISGEVTARVGKNDIMIQDGNNAMRINDATLAAGVAVGNLVDVCGTFFSGVDARIGNLAFGDVISDDTTNSQTPLTSINDATEANRFKYFEISPIQLDSAFNESTNVARIKGSSVDAYFQAKTYVNVGGSFDPAEYAADDYVSLKGIINKTSTTFRLQFVSIQKLAQHTVTFVTNGGSNIDNVTVLNGNTLVLPVDPTKATDATYTYTFAGWYTDVDLEDSFNSSSPIISDLTLYAKWTAEEVDDPAEYFTGINPVNTIGGSESIVAQSKTNNMVFENMGLDNGQIITNIRKGQITLNGAQGANISSGSVPKYFNSGTSVRLYKGNTITFSSPTNITRIEFTLDDLHNVGFALVGEVGEFVDNVWTGNASSVTFSNSNDDTSQVYIKSASVTCGSESLAVNSVFLRFGMTFPKARWTSINSKWAITDYGVMLAKKSTLENTYGVDSIEAAYDAGKTLSVVHSGSSSLPFAPDEDNYGVSAKVNMTSTSNYDVVYCAASFIIAGGTCYFFEEMEYSVKTMAAYCLANGGSNLSDDALSVLIG